MKKYSSISNLFVLDGANHVDVAVVNHEIHEHGSCAAIQPRVILEVFDQRFGIGFTNGKIEILSARSIVRDFAFVEHAMSRRHVRVRPSINYEYKKVFIMIILLFILRIATRTAGLTYSNNNQWGRKPLI